MPLFINFIDDCLYCKIIYIQQVRDYTCIAIYSTGNRALELITSVPLVQKRAGTRCQIDITANSRRCIPHLHTEGESLLLLF